MRDAVLVGADEMAFCGPDDRSLESDPATQTVWRRKLHD
jgi:hypothetical protein